MKRSGIAAVALFVLGTVAALDAHEIGTTRVDVAIDAVNHYRIQIVTDASALAEKLDATSGRIRELTLDATELQRRLAESTQMFLTRAHSDFGVPAASPAVEYAVAPGTDLNPPVATIRLQGAAPAGASHMTWSYGWTFASYALTRQCDGCPTVTDTLEGGQASEAIELRTVQPSAWRVAGQYLRPGFNHILPHGLVLVLFVLGLFLSGRRRLDLVVLGGTFIAAQSAGFALELSGIGQVTAPVTPALLQTLLTLSVLYVVLENAIPMSRVAYARVVPIVGGFGVVFGLSLARTMGTLGLAPGSVLPIAAGFAAGALFAQITVTIAGWVLIGPRWNSHLRLNPLTAYSDSPADSGMGWCARRSCSSRR